MQDKILTKKLMYEKKVVSLHRQSPEPFGG